MTTFLREIDKSKIPRPSTLTIPPAVPSEDVESSEITQSWIWNWIGQFVRPGDILIAESGTAQFGIPDAQLPENITYITQVYYGSIGYAVPTALGAALAQKDQGLDGRIVVIVGDGSLQLTVQEVGTMVKWGLRNIIMFVTTAANLMDLC